MEDQLRDLARRDGRYSFEAYRFLLESLDCAVRLAGKEKATDKQRHVTGKELLEGMRVNAVELFGPLAAPVWRGWGIQTTLDWGNVVFLLVDADMLNRQDSDSIEDFRGGFDFDEAFVQDYKPQC